MACYELSSSKKQQLQSNSACNSFSLQRNRVTSNLLRRLQQLLGDSAGPNPDNRFLCELFLQCLPNHVWMVLASASDMSLKAMAQLANKIMEVATPTVSAVHISPLASEVEQLCTEIALLKDALASLQLPSSQHHLCHSHFRSQAGFRASSPAPTPTGDKPTLCWYHQRFGSQANKCVSPCNSLGSTPGHQSSRHFFVTDHSSGLRFLVDRGAELSVPPISRLPCSYRLAHVNGHAHHLTCIDRLTRWQEAIPLTSTTWSRRLS